MISISTYENDFRSPKTNISQYNTPAYQKWLRVGKEPIDVEKAKCLKNTRTIENRPCNIYAVDELSKRLEWTSMSAFGRLLNPQLLPIEITEEEQRQLSELFDSDDFNFVPCSFDMDDKPLETAVRSISSQKGIEFDKLMKDVYKQREEFHLSAIGQTVKFLKSIFEEKKKKKVQAAKEKEAAEQRKRSEDLVGSSNVAVKPQTKCFGGTWFGNVTHHGRFCKRKPIT